MMGKETSPEERPRPEDDPSEQRETGHWAASLQPDIDR